MTPPVPQTSAPPPDEPPQPGVPTMNLLDDGFGVELAGSERIKLFTWGFIIGVLVGAGIVTATVLASLSVAS
jgi:hypothetical protein